MVVVNQRTSIVPRCVIITFRSGLHSTGRIWNRAEIRPFSRNRTNLRPPNRTNSRANRRKRANFSPVQNSSAVPCTVLIKCMNHKTPQYLCDNFEQRNRIHNRDNRRNGNLHEYIPKFTKFRSSFKYRGTKIWNGLDTELKSNIDLNHFKTKLKTTLIEN
jgi:hypothetical protein